MTEFVRMHREQVEMDEIYQNMDSMKQQDINISPTTQPSQQTENKTAKKRCSRAQSLCLLLLCVLLVAITLLFVYFYTNCTAEKDKLTSDFTAEKDKMTSDFTAEKDKLTSDLIAEKDKLTSDLIAERDKLTRSLTAERDMLTNISSLMAERYRVKLNNQQLSDKSEQLQKEKTDLLESFRYLDGWICHLPSFYYVSKEKKGWHESRQYCRDRGADLIIINNKEELEYAMGLSGAINVWIGLTDIDEEGQWKWVDGSNLNSRFWRSNQPNGGKDENCVLTDALEWHDYPCTDAFNWICEKRFVIS